MTLLTFPQDPLPIRAEAFIAGAWTDITTRIRLANEIVISNRGRANEQGRSSPCTCTFTVNDADNYFSNRAPMGANYGLLPEYTPFRVGVTETRSFAILDTADLSRVKTTDKAVLDITAEIDIRIEYELNNAPDGLTGYILASKYNDGGNASWVFIINKQGYLQLIRSSDGTNLVVNSSTVPVSPQYGPLAARVTYDSDNGAGSRVTKYYTSDSISGSWTQLGATVTTAGTSAIFSGNGELELGRIDGANGGIAEVTGLVGKIYAFELYTGIASPTLVAEADIYNQPRGTTSFSDGLGTPNTWTVEGNAEITPDNRRFTGELVSIETAQDISGNDIYSVVQVADVTRRLGRDDVVNSPLSNYFGALTSTGYWKCEDGTRATSLANSTPRGRPGSIVDVTFSAPSDLPATLGSMSINSTATRIVLTAKSTPKTDFACFNFGMKMSSVPASSVTLFDLYMTGGSISRLNFSVTATQYVIAIYDNDGALLSSNSAVWTSTTPPNVWNLFRIQFEQSGASLDIDLGWYHPGDDVLTGLTTLTVSEFAGRIWQVVSKGSANNLNTQFTQLFVGQFFLNNSDYAYVLAAKAFDGETTVQRVNRVGSENGISVQVVGSQSSAERMGPQPHATPLDILYECADTERTQLYPDRNSTDLIFRTHRSLLNQYGPSLAYSLESGHPAALPRGKDDDGTLRNNVTARRADGSVGFHDRTEGPNGSDAIGNVPGSIDRNTYTSERLTDLAAWDTFLGTWNEYRWIQIPVAFERPNFSGSVADVRAALKLAALDVGDLLTMTGPPSWTKPDDALLLIQGMPTEILGNRKWQINWNTTPYGPYVVNNLTSDAGSRYRVAAGDGYVLAGALDDNDLSFTVTIPTGGKLWGTTATKPGNFPQNVVIGDELITISGITGTASPQTFTASARSVNGVVKTHDAGDAVEVQFPFYTIP